MWIRRADVAGYGKLIDKGLDFAPGLNCVYGPNEAGKTTVLSFLISMLFGQAKAGLKVRKLDDSHDAYVPGKAPSYGGQVTLSLSSGLELLVKRSFSGNADAIDILDARTGRSVAKDYRRDHAREYRFVQDAARIDKSTFENVFVIRHDSVARLDAAEDSSVADRLVALADAGEEKGGAAKAETVLAALLEAIGTERAHKRPYMRTRAALDDARAQYERIRKARAEYADALARKADLASTIQAEETALAAERALLLWSKASALKSLDNERTRLSTEEGALAPADALPDDITRASLSVAQSSIASTRKLHEEALAAETAAAAAFAAAEAKLAALGRFGTLDTEKLRLAEDAVSDFVAKRSMLAAALSAVQGVAAQQAAIRDKWGERHKALSAVAPEEEKLLASAPTTKSLSLEQVGRVTGDIAAATAACARERTMGLASGAGATLMALVAVVSLLALPFTYLAVSGLSAALAAFAGWVCISRLRKAKREGARLTALEADLARLRGDISSLDAAVAAIVSRLGAANADEAAATLRDFHADAARTDSIAADEARLRADAQKALAAVRDAESAMAAAVASIGLPIGASLADALSSFERPASTSAPDAAPACDTVYTDAASPAVVRDMFKPTAAKCRQAASARTACESARAEADRAWASAKATQGRRDAAERGLNVLMQRAGAADAAVLGALIDSRERLSTVRARLKELAAQERMVLAGVSRETFSREAAATPEPAPDAPLHAIDQLQRIERAMDDRRRLLDARRSDYAAACATVDEGLKNLPDVAVVEERIEVLDERRRSQEHHRDAIGHAIRIIADAAGAFHGEVYPKIEQGVTALLSKVTLGAHEKAHLWSDDSSGVRTLRISVSDKERGAPVDPETLSQGTLEQVYLCARLSLIDALSTDERLPVLLDDPFINYDSERLAAGVALLAGVSVRQQVFLFTCQEDVRDLARAAGGAVVTL